MNPMQSPNVGPAGKDFGNRDRAFSGKVNSMVSCCFCGEQFEPWKDEYGDLNDDACRPCDASYEQGQLNDREFGDS